MPTLTALWEGIETGQYLVAGVIGMNNKQEVKVQTRGLDRGNPTPRRQGRCYGAPQLWRRDANAAKPAKGRLVEVIGAWPYRTKVKRRKASLVDEPAGRGEVQSLLKPSAYWRRDGHEVCCSYPMRSVGFRVSGSLENERTRER